MTDENEVEKLKRSVADWLARHDMPRSEARPLHDRYTGVFRITCGDTVETCLAANDT